MYDVEPNEHLTISASASFVIYLKSIDAFQEIYFLFSSSLFIESFMTTKSSLSFYDLAPGHTSTIELL